MGTPEQKTLFICIKYHCLSCRYLYRMGHTMVTILAKLTFCTFFQSVRYQHCKLTCLSNNIIDPRDSGDPSQNGRYNVLPVVSKYADTDLLYTSATY